MKEFSLCILRHACEKSLNICEWYEAVLAEAIRHRDGRGVESSRLRSHGIVLDP